MKASQYILNSLNEIKKKRETLLESESLESAIYRLLLSKKYRKYAINPEYLDHISEVISLAVSKKESIKLTFVFGGYKLWRLPTEPEVDWAELFSLIYYAHWLGRIASIYEPGVWLDFYSDNVVLEIMNNIPKEDTNKYKKSFEKLLQFIKPYLPENLKITLNSVGDQYENYEDFKTELKQSIEKVKSELGGLPKLTPEQRIMVDLNVKLNPGQDNDQHWREKVFLIHEGYSKISKRRPYYRQQDKIFVTTKQIKDSIAVGTTKNSIAKFWTGIGVLEEDGESFKDRILSPTQWENFQNSALRMEKMDLIDLKNFKQIKIFHGFQF
jgi:hypothetical protein